MEKHKNVIILTALVILVLLDMGIYWNAHLYYSALKTNNAAKKVDLLETANRIMPFNEQVWTELGQFYFQAGTNKLNDPDLIISNLEKAYRCLERAVKLNPGFYQSHFYLAHTLLYLSYFSSVDVDAYEIFKKAALLTTFDTQIYFEVGRIMLSNWDDLTESDKKFTVDLLKNVVASGDEEKLLDVLQIWSISISDYHIAEQLIPINPTSYRLYSRFLGEKSLSLRERHKYLIKAETWEFSEAKREYIRGNREFNLFQINSALEHYQKSLRLLNGIRFYQIFSDHQTINKNEYHDLLKDVYLAIIRVWIQKEKDYKKAEPYLLQYFDFENDLSKLDEFETFLHSKGLLETKPSEIEKDPESLYLKTLLNYKMNRFQKIVTEWESFREKYFNPSPENKEYYLRIFQLVGDSYQKIDFIYNAEVFHQKALDIDENRLDTLLRMRLNHLRQNDQYKLEQINKKIKTLVTPREMEFNDLIIEKNHSCDIPLNIEGEPIRISLFFKEDSQTQLPLVTLLFNGEVIFEDFVLENLITFEVDPKPLSNMIQIIPLNRKLILQWMVIENTA
jgi:hypothetical protein